MNKGAQGVIKRGNREKAKDVKLTLKRLLYYVSLYKGKMIIALILTICTNLFALIGPLLSGFAIDAIDFGGEINLNILNGMIVDSSGLSSVITNEVIRGTVIFSIVYRSAMLMAVFYLFSSIFQYTLSILMMRIGKSIVVRMRKDAFEKMIKLPVSYFDTNLIGDILSKFSYDIDTINTSLSSDIIHICTSIITIIGALSMMIIISPIMVLVFVITIPISILFTRFMLRKTTPLFRKRSRTLGELGGFNEEMITGTKTIKAYGKEKNIIEDFDKINNEAALAAYNAEYYGAMTGPGVNFVNNLSFSLICITGAILKIYNMISIGDISSFVLYSRKFSGPINEIANIFVDIQSALAASERVFALIYAEEEKADNIDAISLENTVGNVVLKDVDFSYTEEKKILKSISFDAPKGKVIAIVGPTGSGKTTIVNLLMRFYDIDSGLITLDNENIYNIKRDNLRKSYSMVLQDTWLFQGTIYENLAYGKENATREDIIAAAKAARIHNFIERLPNGYDTVLIDGGVNISKGQKQLLTIARAMLLDAKMLILDEATSNVDTRTEIKIQEAMKTLMKDKTCFIIAHRLSTIQNADKILVIKDGYLVEEGNHTQLMKSKGIYYSLYSSQFE